MVVVTISIGFYGYGFWGRAHANALAKLPVFFPDSPTVEKAVLVGRDETKLPAAVDDLGFERYVTDVTDALDEIDVLYNLGPPSSHVEPSIAALDAGVHVLCEKPLADTLAGAKRMAQAAAESDAVAGIGFNYRFVPAFQYAGGLISDGVIGEVRDIQAQFFGDWLVDPDRPWHWSQSRVVAGSGAHGDLGSHVIDLVRFLVEAQTGEITHVSGQLRTFVDERPAESGGTQQVDVDDAAHAIVSFENGAFGRLDASRVAPAHRTDLRVEVHGSAGSLRVAFGLGHLGTLHLYREGEDDDFQRVPVLEDPAPYVDQWWPFLPVYDGVDTVMLENRAFMRAVETGEPHETSFADGLAVQRVIDAIARSDEQGSRMEIHQE